MNLFGIEPLMPAYGRKYSTIEEAQKDFNRGLDFMTAHGQYCSIRDFKDKIDSIQVRFGEKSIMGGYTETGMLLI